MATEEVFNFGPVPALPRTSVTATYSELELHPERYFQASNPQDTNVLLIHL